MSMRDFMTRVSNTPTIAKTIQHIAVPTIAKNPTTIRQALTAPTRLDPPYTCGDGAGHESGLLKNPLRHFHWDIESRSAAVLGGKQGVGVRAYAEHPTTGVLCVSFARGNGPIETWTPGQPIPETVRAAAADPSCSWVAHNAAFERAMLEGILVPQHGWPMLPVERHVCTMSLALSHAYPGSLDGVAEALGLMNRKDAAREKAVRVMWKPRKPRHGEDPTGIYWVDTPELRAELAIYNRQDVAVEREAHQHPKLTPLLASEQDTWVLDAEINDNGILIDERLARAASPLSVQAHTDLDERMRLATGGAVDRASKNEKLKAWLTAQGVKLPQKQRKGKTEPTSSLDADDIEMLLAGQNLTPNTRAPLEIRLQAAQSATTKIDRMLTSRCADGRVRGLFRFHGATTGRWSGAGFQPQNLKRPELLKTDEAIAEAIAMVLAGDYTAIKARYGDVLRAIGDLSRSMIIPAPGYRFLIGDFSGIEARDLAFLAGDADKLERFRQFDLGHGRDPYCIAAEEILGLAEVTAESPERALGKVFELGLGFGMGDKRLLATIRKANIPGTGQTTLEDATRWVQTWRARNPRIVEYWAQLARMRRSRDPGG
jgi:DNA polymerase